MNAKVIHGAIGIGGTIATMSLEGANVVAGICAGVATTAWMLRQLWLSCQKRNHHEKHRRH